MPKNVRYKSMLMTGLLLSSFILTSTVIAEGLDESGDVAVEVVSDSSVDEYVDAVTFSNDTAVIEEAPLSENTDSSTDDKAVDNTEIDESKSEAMDSSDEKVTLSTTLPEPKVDKIVNAISSKNSGSENTIAVNSSTNDPVNESSNSFQSLTESVVGTLTPLGVSDKSKPVGKLTRLRTQLPNTSGGISKGNVIMGLVLSVGSIIWALFVFSKRIFD